jgi:hypothetical protein
MRTSQNAYESGELTALGHCTTVCLALIRTVVVGLLPPWKRLEAELLVEGVTAAAQAKRRNQQGLAAC